eukprot:741049-Rhodomonas_salina.4
MFNSTDGVLKVDEESLSACQRVTCFAASASASEEEEYYCAPGCNGTMINDGELCLCLRVCDSVLTWQHDDVLSGICDAFCMTPACTFDGGDCLSVASYAAATRCP